MNEYKYVFIRKYPFLKRKELTETELIMLNAKKVLTILPVILFIATIYRILRKLRVIK